jgi:hypothetical protein
MMGTPLNMQNVQLAGRSGELYLFAVWRRETHFQAKGGVYVMARSLGGDQFTIVYIGETGDMSARPLNQSKLGCFNKHGVDHIFTLDEQDPKRRATIAADLVQALAPVCNGP